MHNKLIVVNDTHTTINFDKHKYLSKLAFKESSNDYTAIKGNHVGLFQLSKVTYNDIVKHCNFAITWDTLCKDSLAQIDAQMHWMSRQMQLFKHYDLLKYIGMQVKYDSVTYNLSLSSMFAASHLCGVKALKTWLESNCEIESYDANKVSLATYAYEFHKL